MTHAQALVELVELPPPNSMLRVLIFTPDQTEAADSARKITARTVQEVVRNLSGQRTYTRFEPARNAICSTVRVRANVIAQAATLAVDTLRQLGVERVTQNEVSRHKPPTTAEFHELEARVQAAEQALALLGRAVDSPIEALTAVPFAVFLDYLRDRRFVPMVDGERTVWTLSTADARRTLVLPTDPLPEVARVPLLFTCTGLLADIEHRPRARLVADLLARALELCP